MSNFVRVRKRTRVPVVWSRAECERLFEAMEGTPRLMAELMFGSGIRLTELLRLRVNDVDLERGQLVVRAGKGDQGRVRPRCAGFQMAEFWWQIALHLMPSARGILFVPLSTLPSNLRFGSSWGVHSHRPSLPPSVPNFVTGATEFGHRNLRRGTRFHRS